MSLNKFTLLQNKNYPGILLDNCRLQIVAVCTINQWFNSDFNNCSEIRGRSSVSNEMVDKWKSTLSDEDISDIEWAIRELN